MVSRPTPEALAKLESDHFCDIASDNQSATIALNCLAFKDMNAQSNNGLALAAPVA